MRAVAEGNGDTGKGDGPASLLDGMSSDELTFAANSLRNTYVLTENSPMDVYWEIPSETDEYDFDIFPPKGARR